jgi:uridine kinase
LRAHADLTVFIDAHVAQRRARRMARDVAERGRRADETAAQFDAVVEPMHVEHVEPQRGLAQRIIVNAGDLGALEAAARELAGEIEAALASSGDWAQ